MKELIDKSAVVAEIEKRIKKYVSIDVGHIEHLDALYGAKCKALMEILSFLDTLEVIDPYEKCVQYASIKAGIQAHAETYSFNIESELFNQLSKEQQVLWRKEIEQACISGGEVGVELAKDPRYKKNVKVKEVDCDKEIGMYTTKELLWKRNKATNMFHLTQGDIDRIAKHFFELGLKINKGE